MLRPLIANIRPRACVCLCFNRCDMPVPFRFKIDVPARRGGAPEERARLMHNYQSVETGKLYPTTNRVIILAWCGCVAIAVVLVATIGYVRTRSTNTSYSHTRANVSVAAQPKLRWALPSPRLKMQRSNKQRSAPPVHVPPFPPPVPLPPFPPFPPEPPAPPPWSPCRQCHRRRRRRRHRRSRRRSCLRRRRPPRRRTRRRRHPSHRFPH